MHRVSALVLALLASFLVVAAPDSASASRLPVQGRFAVSNGRPIAGTTTSFWGRTGTRGIRPVRLQIRVGGTWHNVGRTRSGRLGRFRIPVQVPHTERATYAYRALFPAARVQGRLLRGAVSPQARVTTQPTEWTALSATGLTSCGVRNDQSLRCWGYNGDYELGNGTTTDALRPVVVPGQWRAVFTGDTHNCAVGIDGRASCFGTYYQAPGEPWVVHPRPTALPGTGWKAFVLSDNYSQCGMKTDGSTWCWGRNIHSEFANDNQRTVPFSAPVELTGSWASLSISDGTVCGIRTDATGWCWGDNRHDATGAGTLSVYKTPQQLPGTWLSLTTSAKTTCGVRTDHSAYCWGENAYGSVDRKQPADVVSPVLLPGAWGTVTPTPTKNTCGLGSNGTAWCWGRNNEGQLGTGTVSANPDTAYGPTKLAGPATWTSLLATGGATCGQQSDRSVWCFGDNAAGAGAGSSGPTAPHRVTVAGWTWLGKSAVDGYALSPDRQLWGWGNNDFGQLATGARTAVPHPASIRP